MKRHIHLRDLSEATLGESWYRPDEPLDDVHGYLPQMLEEAALELQKQVEHGSPLYYSLNRAILMLKAEMKRLYDEQMTAKP